MLVRRLLEWGMEVRASGSTMGSNLVLWTIGVLSMNCEDYNCDDGKNLAR